MHKVTRSDQASGAQRKDRPKKRRQSFNPKTAEVDEKSFTSTSAKKLRSQDEIHVPEDGTLICHYRLFFLYFQHYQL